MSARELATATGTAAALATCLVHGDGEAWAATVATLPDRLPPVLEDAGLLFSDAAWWTLAASLGGEVANPGPAWQAARADVIAELADRHGMPAAEVPAVVDWLGVILADPGRAYVPAHDGALFLTVALIATAELFACWPERWPLFLIEREVHGHG